MSSRNLWASHVNALASSGMEKIMKRREELLERLADDWASKKNKLRRRLGRRDVSQEQIENWKYGGILGRAGSPRDVADRAFSDDYEVLALLKMLCGASISSDHHILISGEEWRVVVRWRDSQ